MKLWSVEISRVETDWVTVLAESESEARSIARRENGFYTVEDSSETEPDAECDWHNVHTSSGEVITGREAAKRLATARAEEQARRDTPGTPEYIAHVESLGQARLPLGGGR